MCDVYSFENINYCVNFRVDYNVCVVLLYVLYSHMFYICMRIALYVCVCVFSYLMLALIARIWRLCCTVVTQNVYIKDIIMCVVRVHRKYEFNNPPHFFYACTLLICLLSHLFVRWLISYYELVRDFQ